MDLNAKWGKEKLAERTIKNLEKNNIEGFYVEDEAEALEKVKSLLKESSLVAAGGSMTLNEIGVIDLLKSGKYEFLDRNAEGLSFEEVKAIYRKSFCADTYLTSTNALTEEGELYNIDGNGNRVAAMIYGPDQVIVITGVNKIVRNMEEAKNRLERYCAPVNMKRLNRKTPCTVTGMCHNCNSPERGCCNYVVIRRQKPGRMKVIIVGKELGY